MEELAKITNSLQVLLAQAVAGSTTPFSTGCLQCGNQNIRTRGLCSNCYSRTRKKIRDGADEDVLIANGLISPRGNVGGRKPTIRTKLDDAADLIKSTTPRSAKEEAAFYEAQTPPAKNPQNPENVHSKE